MTVAVALGHTPRGRAALRAAAEEAVLRGQELAVLHIVDGADDVEDNDPVIAEEVAAQLSEIAGLSWKLHTAPKGFDKAEALLEQVEQVGATLLVIGSRRRTPVGKLLLGSTVQRVLLESRIPVLVVKAT